MTADLQAVISVYRSIRRQVRLLPTEYLRQFFRIKLGDDVRSVWKSIRRGNLSTTRIGSLRKELRKLQKANTGNRKSFSRLLDFAYGRKGKLRWEILEPFLSDPNVPPPDRIIAEVEKSRPPVYSPELAALLTNGHSRTTKALRFSALKAPPLLPERANPDSEEARLLGRLSKRREVNIRWRYFQQEWKKVLPPLQVLVEQKTDSGEPQLTASLEALRNSAIRPIGLQGAGVMEEVQALARSPSKEPCTQSGSSSHSLADSEDTSPPQFDSHLPRRFLRRRYQELLGRLPILIYSPGKNAPKTLEQASSRYQVSLSQDAIKHTLRFTPNRIPEASTTALAWLDTRSERQNRQRRS